MCWRAQFESPLANDFRLVAIDLRGHGQSEAPLGAENYTHGELWAEDVRNVQNALNLVHPILVGWSYAGFVIGDYLRRYGDAEIAGINFVCAAIGMGERWFGDYIGPGFLDHVPARVQRIRWWRCKRCAPSFMSRSRSRRRRRLSSWPWAGP
ncbi:MAG: alpha/beta fold hydrolase [Hyphomonadaceae bacterium]